MIPRLTPFTSGISAQGSVICDASSMSAMWKSIFLNIPKPAPIKFDMRIKLYYPTERKFLTCASCKNNFCCCNTLLSFLEEPIVFINVSAYSSINRVSLQVFVDPRLIRCYSKNLVFAHKVELLVQLDEPFKDIINSYIRFLNLKERRNVIKIKYHCA